MNATDYPVMLTWSKEDKAYLARVVHLPGCMADGKTKGEALENVQLAIAEWIEAVKEMGYPVPPPMDDATLEAVTLNGTEGQAKRLKEKVQEEVETILKRLIPEIVREIVNNMPNLTAGASYQAPSRPVRSKGMAALGKA